VGEFWGGGVFDGENNVLFGEGGAGAFSDGKLTSRTKDLAAKDFFLHLLVACGAAPEIIYDAQPHLGSDGLARIMPRWREKIIAAGGEFRFGTRVDDFIVDAGRVRGVKISAHDGGAVSSTEMETGAVFLATGHSADTVYHALAAHHVRLVPKGFALGVRVEIPQKMVTRALYPPTPTLGAASFFLTHRGRCHSFCCCPGGRVIACAARAGKLFTNGMSLSARAGEFINAAFLLPQLAAPENCGAGTAAGGAAAGDAATDAALEKLREFAELESKIFRAGGSDYALPATTLAAFPAPSRLPKNSAARGVSADFREFLPPPIIAELAHCLPEMLKQIGAPSAEAVTIFGAETRSTSPVRILRGAAKDSGGNYESINLPGLYPLGEAAGYAGGIVSCAIDGARAAQAYLLALRS
jgi:uncharacterized FAD-dependent dehydrogenase